MTATDQEMNRESGGRRNPKILYGLPCACCRTYYASNLEICPLCGSSDRVSPRPALTQRVAAF